MVSFGKSLSVAACNWKVLLKSLVCQTIVLALCLAVVSSFWGGAISDLIGLMQNGTIVNFVNDTIKSVADGSFDANVFADNFNKVIAAVGNEVAEIAKEFGNLNLTVLVAFCLLVAYRMLVAVTDVTVECQLDEFLTSNASRPFSWFFFKKHGETWKFMLLQTAFALPLDALIIFGCAGFYLMFAIMLSWWAIIPVAILALVLYTARLTLFAFTLPAVATEKNMKTGDAFRSGISLVVKRFWRVFAKNFVVVILIATMFVVSVLFVDNTFWAAFLSVAPGFVLFFVLKCINICEYFEATDRPYFYKVMMIDGTDRFNKRHRQA